MNCEGVFFVSIVWYVLGVLFKGVLMWCGLKFVIKKLVMVCSVGSCITCTYISIN